MLLVPIDAMAGQISLAWNASPTAGVSYRLYYGTSSSPQGNHPNQIVVGPQTSYTVLGLSDGVRYYFVVKAVLDSVESGPSNEVNGFAGSALSFTDSPLVPGVHSMKLVHMTELRGRIDGLRKARGVAPVTWTSLSAGMMIRGTHITELRNALNTEYTARGLTAPTYADHPLAVGTQIKAVHITQLRAFVVAIGG